MAKKGQKFKSIDENLILKIVKEKINGKTYSDLSLKYKIPRGSIMTWVKRYNDKGTLIEKKMNKKRS